MAAAESGYPQPRRDMEPDDYFGEKVADPYRWMESIDSPETKAWVAAERERTAAFLAAIPERAAIRARLKQLWNFPKYGLPDKVGDRLFFTKNDGLQNQPVLYVADGAAGAPRVLLDPNALSKDGTVALRLTSPSPDGKLLGYGLAVGGSDWDELHVRRVDGGADLPDVIHWAKFSGLSWTKDCRGFFYGRYPAIAEANKLFGRLSHRQIYYHALGTDQAADRLIFEMRDQPDWFCGAGTTDDGRYLVISVSRNDIPRNAFYYVDLGDPMAPRLDAPIVRLLNQFDAQYSYIGSIGPVFYLNTTLDAPRGRVIAVDVSKPGAPWTTPVPEGADSIDNALVVGGKIAVSTFHDVKSQFFLYAADGSSRRELALPGIVALESINGRGDDPELFYAYSSFLAPPTVMACDTATGAETVFRKPATPFDPSPYETRQVFCTSKDGTRIPIFVTSKKGLKLDGTTPAWLYGYGGFNIAIPPEYSPARAVWLEMGGLFAQATLRGGGEYGEAWHLAGTKERKQNVFDDFIAAADFLVDQHYTSRDRLVIEGRSNGGLLIGAVVNQRPALCAVALPTVGVMDMLRYHTFTIGSAWASDYGTSADPEGFRYLRAYSPLHNVKPGVKYPAIMVMTGDHDDRVFPAHSFKYAATLQYESAKVPGSGPIVVRIEVDAGHGGSSGTSPSSKTIDEWVDKLGFVAHFMPPGTLGVPGGP